MGADSDRRERPRIVDPDRRRAGRVELHHGQSKRTEFVANALPFGVPCGVRVVARHALLAQRPHNTQTVVGTELLRGACERSFNARPTQLEQSQCAAVTNGLAHQRREDSIECRFGESARCSAPRGP